MNPSSTYREELHTPIAHQAQVVVCGGGTAGFVAALAAARAGARTLLLERNSLVGGTMINGAGPLHSFFNLFKAVPGASKRQLVRGLPQEIIDRLAASGFCRGHLEMDKGGDYDSVITIIDWEGFKDTAFTMLEEAGVDLLLNVQVAGVMKEGDRVTGVITEGKSGRQAIQAQVVVDATGDGDVAALAGADYVKKHGTSSVGFPFGMARVDMRRLASYLQEQGLVTQLVRGPKDLPDGDDVIRLGFDLTRDPRFSAFMAQSGMWGPLGFSYHSDHFTFINTANKRQVDATDTRALSQALVELRHQVMALSRLLIQHIPGFEQAYVCWTPNNLGVRYTRAITCEKDLSLEEIVGGARFPDEVFLYGFHDCAPRIQIRDAGCYGFPYRALLPKKVEGLLVAGRLLTSDWDAHMSTRNTVSCMAQGEAAGTAAALCAASGTSPRALDPQVLRARLRAQGVYLGE